MTASETDLWVFRDGKKAVSGRKLLHHLRNSLATLCRSPRDSGAQSTALIQAGEIEAALADVKSPAAVFFAKLTDAVAALGLGDCDTASFACLASEVESQHVPDSLTISPPEGFTYYALQPSSFGQFAREALKHRQAIAVIGIRSIGTTLSAVVAAALRADGHPVERITVRPVGHPYDRITEFDFAQRSWIARNRAVSASFVVADEGPGRSGSTFLSVGEALLSAGVARDSILFFGSREPDVNQLCARDAVARWTSFNFLVATSHVHTRFNDDLYLGGGEWRRFLIPQGMHWPASWTQAERLKFLSVDRKQLVKFEGLGRSGAAVREHARLLHQLGFGTAMEDAGDGFTSYALIQGRPLREADASPDLLETAARYCAMRSREFATEDGCSERVSDMVRFNSQLEFGIELDFDSSLLDARQLVLTDGRMQPYEWIRSSDGRLLKVDATTHGDDHFFPGPTDIAWDIAGLAVEWNLDTSALDFVIGRFREITGDDLRLRLPAFIFAYTIARMASWKMALSTVLGSDEEHRVRHAYARYRHLAEQQLEPYRKQPTALLIPSCRPPAIAA